ncbi:MAG: AMP-binding protein [bacterium]|nr:AMP-binding protein [bacterium]
MRIIDLLERNASLYGTKSAAVITSEDGTDSTEGGAVSFAELRHRVLSLAAGLRAMGVEHGDRLALLADNGLVYFDIYLAGCYLGAPIVPLSIHWTSLELESVLNDADPALVIADETYIANLPAPDGRTPVISTQSNAYFDLLAGAPPQDPNSITQVAEDAVTEDATALIVYTSGTTGNPKGVCLSQRALAFSGFTTALVQRFVPEDVFLSTTPLFHTAAGTRVLSMLADGQTHVVLRRFSPETFFAAVATHRPSVTILVPTQLRRILEHPALSQADLSSLRLIVYGGEPATAALIRQAHTQLGCDLYQAYGLTECVGNVAGLLPQDHNQALAQHPERLTSAGRAVPGVRIEIRNPEGIAVTAGEVGEIWVRTAKAMSGYWKRPQLTAQTLVNGWVCTGDLGRLDDHGYLYLVGRATDMLISGGVNVYPSQIEAVLCEHPHIAAVAVVGRSDSDWGERPVAFVELEPTPTALHNPTAIPQELSLWCASRLSKPQIPDEFIVVPKLERTSTGKVRKAELKKRLT